MKIYGLDGKEYPTVEECTKADEAYIKAKKNAEIEEAEKKAVQSRRKKEKADAIKLAEDALGEAQAAYDKAEEEAREIISKAKDKARELIAEASSKVQVLQQKRYEAIAAFNKEFGTYTTTYTGKEALDEYNRMTRNFHSALRTFFNNWF